MKGFFTKEETKSTTRKDGKTYSCISCGMYKTCNSPKIKPSGNFKKGILNVFDFPSSKEDSGGYFLLNPVIKKMFTDNNIDVNKDCLNTYAMKCNIGELNPTKVNFNIDCCRLHLMRVIKKHKPKIINVFGINALYAVIGARWKGGLGSFEKWRGWVIPDQDFKCYIAPIYPVYAIVGDTKGNNLQLLASQDIKNAISYLDKPFKPFIKPKIHILRNGLRRLSTIKSGDTIAFDYETTGLKPHDKGHRIVCASVAPSGDLVYVFQIPKEKEKRLPFVRLLKNGSIKKAAHNIFFEQSWSLIRLGVRVKNWYWDSMQMAHILDNRSGATGLKFQTYVNFGLMDYSSEVSPHLKGDKKNANSKNKLQKYVENEHHMDLVLEYCALDSALQFRLMELQRDIVENKILPF